MNIAIVGKPFGKIRYFFLNCAFVLSFSVYAQENPVMVLHTSNEGKICYNVDKIDSITFSTNISFNHEEFQNLNINSSTCNNMIWTWWFYPQVITYNEHVYWTFANNDGYSGLAEFNINEMCTKKTFLRQTPIVDDHNGMAFIILNDGTILCAYAGGHNTDNNIHIRLSQTPYNIDLFSDVITLESNSKTCYSQLIKSNEFVFLFYRIEDTKWAYRYTKDGREWSNEIIIVEAPMQYYCKFMPTTEADCIRICMYSNPKIGDNWDARIRQGFFHLNDLNLFNSDNTTYLGHKEVNYQNFDIVVNKGDNETIRMFDVAKSAPNQLKILYCKFSTFNNSVYYLYDKGVNIPICNGGKAFWRPKYQGGASFLNDSTIVLSREEENMDIIEMVKIKNNEITDRMLVHSESLGADEMHREIRPICDINGKAFLWQSGYYNYNTYKDFETNARLIVNNRIF